MKLYIIAGEDSGDLHGSNLIAALRKLRPDLEIRGVGGDKLADQGVELVAHVRDINFMGFIEIVKNLGTIRKLFRTVKQDIDEWKPDATILIDYPAFNLRLAPFFKKLGTKVFYYISPQVWAWKKNRVKQIRQFTDRLFVILPFEKDFYAKEGLDVDFVGHPLMDVIRTEPGHHEKNPVVALLPGSRKQEIQRMLPIMLEVADRFPAYEFVVAGAPSQAEEFYLPIIGGRSVKLEMGKTYEVLKNAKYALVTSGTATLETALYDIPQVVCYKGRYLSYLIGKRLVNVKYISLVNLILDRLLITELIQTDLTPDKLEHELQNLMDPIKERRVKLGYVELRQKLGQQGASKQTAELINQYLGDNSPVAVGVSN